MAYDKNNIFAKILRGELPSRKVYEDEYALAFEDIAPAAPTHVLVVPKVGFESFAEFVAGATDKQVHGFFAAVQKTVAKLGVDKTGYRLISNNGTDAVQTVAHFHVHILGGRTLGKLLP